MSRLPVRLILTALVYMCCRTGCPGNADVATLASWPHTQFECPPSCANEPHPSTATTSCFAFASEEELSKLAEGVTPANTAKTTAWALNDFQHWMAIIIVTFLHAVHVYRYYVAAIIIINFAAYNILFMYINYSIIMRLLYNI